MRLGFSRVTASRARFWATMGFGVCPLFYLWLLALMQGLEGEIRHPLGDPAPLPVVVYSAAFVLLCAGVVRARPEAKVTWSDWGVTEWLGAGARRAIPWGAARYIDFAGSKNELLCSVTDGAGRTIDVRSGRGALKLDRSGRYAASSGAFGAAASDNAVVHTRAEYAPRRTAAPLTLVEGLGLLGYLGAAGALAKIALGSADDLWVAAAVALLGARALHPAWLALSLPRRPREAEPVTFVESRGTVLTVRGRDQATWSFDTAGLYHPDAGLASRLGPAHVVRAAPTAGGAYRAGGLATVTWVRTEALERADRRLALALGLETAFRLMVAAMPLVPWLLVRSSRLLSP